MTATLLAAEPLQQAVIELLRGSAGVLALVPADRIWSDAPTQPPAGDYITLGPDHALPRQAQDFAGGESFLQVDVWSAAATRLGAKRIVDAVASALHDVESAQPGGEQTLLQLTVEETRVIREADAKTWHGMVTVRALTEPLR